MDNNELQRQSLQVCMSQEEVGRRQMHQDASQKVLGGAEMVSCEVTKPEGSHRSQLPDAAVSERYETGDTSSTALGAGWLASATSNAIPYPPTVIGLACSYF